MDIPLTSRQSGWLAVGTACVLLIGYGMSRVAEGSLAIPAAVLTMATLFIAGAIAFAVWRARTVVRGATDEGGLRVDGRSSSEYVPFASMRGAKLHGAVLSLETTRGPRAFRLHEELPRDLAATIAAGIERARSAMPPPIAAHLGRDDEPLDRWLERARALGSGDQYRQRAVDLDSLVSFVDDRDADPELRAAAAHAIVWSGEAASREQVAAAIGPRTPPIVVVAAALATRYGTYVEGFDEALRYLSLQDRALARRMMEARPRTRIAASSSEADDEAAEAEAEQKGRM